jgi:hypothetical protein
MSFGRAITPLWRGPSLCPWQRMGSVGLALHFPPPRNGDPAFPIGIGPVPCSRYQPSMRSGLRNTQRGITILPAVLALSGWGCADFHAFSELRIGKILRRTHDPTDSLRVFSESPTILGLFGARRLSQQHYPSFPEPPKCANPNKRGHCTMDYFGTPRRALVGANLLGGS